MKRAGKPVVRAGVVQPLSSAVQMRGDVLFVSGQVPMIDGRPAAADVAGQTHAVIDSLEAILHEHGCALSDVVKTTVWLTDKTDYPEFNAAYGQRFGPAFPARSTVIADLIAPVKLEIEAIAAIPET